MNNVEALIRKKMKAVLEAEKKRVAKGLLEAKKPFIKDTGDNMTLNDLLPKSPGPVHVSASMHSDLTRGGWNHMHGLSKNDPTHDYYEHKNHGRIMIDANGNHKKPRPEGFGHSWASSHME